MKNITKKITLICSIMVASTIVIEAQDIDISKGYMVATLISESTTYNDDYSYFYEEPVVYKPVHVYKKKYYRVPKIKNKTPILTNDMKIQKALKSLGFYRASIDGLVQSYETKLAIKKMHKEYKNSNDTFLSSKEKETLIYLGTLFSLDKSLISKRTNERAHYKRIQAALKILGYYHGRVDGISGRGTRKAISEYKVSQSLPSNPSLTFNQESELLNNAKSINDTNIEEAINSLKEPLE